MQRLAKHMQLMANMQHHTAGLAVMAVSDGEASGAAVAGAAVHMASEYLLTKTIRPSEKIGHAGSGRFRSRTVPELVLVKHGSLQLARETADGRLEVTSTQVLTARVLCGLVLTTRDQVCSSCKKTIPHLLSVFVRAFSYGS